MKEPEVQDTDLTEAEALKQAKAEGIEFVDHFIVDGDETKYATIEEAKEVAGKKNITQVRTRK